MKNVKGQITLFVIIGIVIIAIIAIFLSMRSQVSETKPVSKGVDVEPVQLYVESCIKSVGEDAIVFTSRQGGYFELPELSTTDYFSNTAYYFSIDKNLMPSQERVEKEISKYMDNELFFCLKNFEDFRKEGMDIKIANISTTTLILPSSVLFKVNMPLTIKTQQAKTGLSDFSGSLENIRLKTIYNITKDMTEEQMKKFDSICVSCILRMAIENDVYVDLQRLGNDTVVFTITDNNSIVKNQPLEYVFANKYNVSWNST